MMPNCKIFMLLLTALVISNTIFAQDTVFYYGSNNRILSADKNAKYKKEINHRSDNKHVIKTFAHTEKGWVKVSTERIKNKKNNQLFIRFNGKNLESGIILRKIKREEDVIQFSEFHDGKIIRTGEANQTIPLHLHGKVTEYYPDGTIKSEAQYKNNQLISNTLWLEDGTKYAENVFFSVDEAPEYKLGQQQFNQFILHRLKAEDLDLSQYNETVLLGWIITDTGKLEGARILEGNYRKLNRRLVSIVEELPGTWQPAHLKGENVNYFMKFPINFRHEEPEYFDSLEMSRGYLIWN